MHLKSICILSKKVLISANNYMNLHKSKELLALLFSISQVTYCNVNVVSESDIFDIEWESFESSEGSDETTGFCIKEIKHLFLKNFMVIEMAGQFKSKIFRIFREIIQKEIEEEKNIFFLKYKYNLDANIKKISYLNDIKDYSINFDILIPNINDEQNSKKNSIKIVENDLLIAVTTKIQALSHKCENYEKLKDKAASIFQKHFDRLKEFLEIKEKILFYWDTEFEDKMSRIAFTCIFREKLFLEYFEKIDNYIEVAISSFRTSEDVQEAIKTLKDNKELEIWIFQITLDFFQTTSKNLSTYTNKMSKTTSNFCFKKENITRDSRDSLKNNLLIFVRKTFTVAFIDTLEDILYHNSQNKTPNSQPKRRKLSETTFNRNILEENRHNKLYTETKNVCYNLIEEKLTSILMDSLFNLLANVTEDLETEEIDIMRALTIRINYEYREGYDKISEGLVNDKNFKDAVFIITKSTIKKIEESFCESDNKNSRKIKKNEFLNAFFKKKPKIRILTANKIINLFDDLFKTHFIPEIRTHLVFFIQKRVENACDTKENLEKSLKELETSIKILSEEMNLMNTIDIPSVQIMA